MKAPDLGRAVQRARKARGQDVATVAELLGMSGSWVEKFEAGHVAEVHPAVRLAVALVYDVPADCRVGVWLLSPGCAGLREELAREGVRLAAPVAR